MQSISIESEIGLFLQSLIVNVQQDSEKIEVTFLNLGCNFHIGSSVPHSDLIKSAFLNSHCGSSEINIYLSSDTDSFKLSRSKLLEVIQNLHPTINRFGDYRFSADPSGNFLYFYNGTQKIGGVWIAPSVSEMPEMLITPFRTLISWILEEVGGVILHASSFTLDGKSVLLAGPSGSGKSTIAFEALSQSENVICDDAIALTSAGCFPIYSKMKMKSNLESIEVSGSQLTCEQVGSKSVINLTQISNFQQVGYLPNFLLFPSLNSESAFDEISTGEAMKKIMTDSFSETLGAPLGALRLIYQALSKVRTLNWRLAPDSKLNWEELKAQVSKI
jgi:hypothetical protein